MTSYVGVGMQVTRMWVVAAVLFGACSPAAEIGDAEAMFRGGPAHVGVYDGGNVEGLEGVRWRFPTHGAVRSSPTLAGDALYVGSSDGRLYALDADDGNLLWAYDAGSPINSSAAVAGGHVYFGDRAGVLHAVGLSQGDSVWRLRTGADAAFPWGEEGWDYYTSSPAVVGGTVVFGGGDGGLYGVDAATGDELWRYATDHPIRSSPAVANGVVYVGGTDGRLHAVALDTGEGLWRYDTEGASLDSGEFGFDRRSVQSSPAVADGRVFFGARDGFLYAIDAGTGELVWRFDQEVSWCNTSPAVTQGIVYAGTSDGLFVHALDSDTGSELWRTPTGGRVFASPSVSGESVLVGDHAGTLYSLDRSSGAVRWTFPTGGAIQSSAVPGGGAIYFGSDDGTVYALQGTDGASTRHAVYWDSAGASVYQGHEALEDHLVGYGYETLDGPALVEFMAQSVATGEASVVVFAMDQLPAEVAGEPADSVLLRRYLDAGGRVVWVGFPPMGLEQDPESGQIRVNLARTTALLDVAHSGATMDEYSWQATPEGRAWGLPEWGIDAFGVDAGGVATVLATDDRGRATAWVAEIGEGSFVRLWGRLDPMPYPEVVRRLAEHTQR